MKWKDKLNWKYMQISLYVIITVIIIYFLSLLIKNAPTIIIMIVEKVSWILKVVRPVILGFVFAYLMDPIVNFIEKKYSKISFKNPFNKYLKKQRQTRHYELKTPRTWAAVTSVIFVVITAIGLISLLVFTVTNQLRLANFDDIVKLSEEYMNSITELYNSILMKLKELDIQSSEFEQYVRSAATSIFSTLISITDTTLSTIQNISGYLTTIIFSFIIGFYFLIDGRMIMNYIKKVFKTLFGERTNNRILRIVHDIDYVFSGYIRGQLTDAFLMMILISILLSITGVKFAIVIGIFAGIGNLIPYFGPVIAYISTAIVCLINGELKRLIISLIVLLIIQFIDGNVIGPKLLSRSIKIHPLIIIISLIFGSALGGFLGMLLAVPAGAYVKLVFVRFIERKYEQKQQLENEK